MGYLECQECGGKYELDDHESADDFSDKCECGGKLTYFKNSDTVNKEKAIMKKEESFITCPYCNYDNNPEAQFCKKCGKKLKENLITRFNTDLNLLAVFIGLAVSCIVLILGSFLFGSIVAAASLDLSIYVGLVMVIMVFCGGITTGIVGCDDVKEGARNGIFMSLIALVILGFVVGVMLFITMGVAAAISSAFEPYTSSSAYSSSITTSTTSEGDSLDFVFTIIKGIVILVLVFVSGAVGGSFGVFLKKGFNN